MIVRTGRAITGQPTAMAQPTPQGSIAEPASTVRCCLSITATAGSPRAFGILREWAASTRQSAPPETSIAIAAGEWLYSPDQSRQCCKQRRRGHQRTDLQEAPGGDLDVLASQRHEPQDGREGTGNRQIRSQIDADQHGA